QEGRGPGHARIRGARAGRPGARPVPAGRVPALSGAGRAARRGFRYDERFSHGSLQRNPPMPILNVQIMQGHSAQQKSELLTRVSQAVVDSLAAQLASVRIVLQEVPPEHVIVAGELGKDMALLRVMLIEGRTEEKKAAMLAAVSRAVHDSIGISEE